MEKRRLLALFALALSAALGACSSSGIHNPMDGTGGGTQGYTVSFEKNCAGSMEEFARKKLNPPTRIVEDFPENPTCPGHRFVEWNTARDGSGTAFTTQTPIPPNEILVIVYAKWVRTQLSVVVFPSTLPFSPMTTGSYGGNSATLSVVVSGLVSSEDANSVELSLDKPGWLSFDPPLVSVSGGTKTFKVNFSYPGTAFDKDPAQIHLGLANVPKEYEHDNTPRSVRVLMGDGQNRPIPVSQANIQEFNEYARTNGLRMHYRLVENVVLEAPVAPKTSNWEAIGTNNKVFTGSLDGDGHTLSGLVIDSPGNNYQGLFGVIGQGALIENLGLIGLRVSASDRNSVGGLVGRNNGGTVENSYVMGSVEGNSQVGGLVGYNWEGTVQNSYATGSVEGSGDNVGGLVGYNWEGAVQNSYATGSVSGNRYVGGLVGGNFFQRTSLTTVQNCVALNSRVISAGGSTSIGRVVGDYANLGPNPFSGSTLSNNHAWSGMDMRHGVDENGNGGAEPSIISNSAGKNGQSVSAGSGPTQYNNLLFWSSSPLSWDFDALWQWGANGLPILQNVGGAQNHTVP